MSLYNYSVLNQYYNILKNNLTTGRDLISPTKFTSEKNSTFEIIERKTGDGSYNFTSLMKVKLGNGRTVSIPTIRDRIVIEVIKNRLKSKFRIKFKNREEVIQALIGKLNANIPYFIIRLDIKSFFSSIDHGILINKIQRSALLDFEELILVKKIIKLDGNPGIPQGLSISSILAEVYLEDFDQKMRLIHPSIAYYARYVDDIIILINGNISSSNQQNIRGQINNIFKDFKLSINQDKASYTQFKPLSNKESKKLLKHIPSQGFNYLGYAFQLENSKLSISIATDKVDKIKSKMNTIFNDYKSNLNVFLLQERLKFLTFKKTSIKQYSFITKEQEIVTLNRKIYFGILESYKHVPVENKVWEHLDKYIRGKLLQLKHLKLINSNKEYRKLHSHFFTKSLENNYIYKFHKLTKIDIINLLIKMDPSLNTKTLIKYTRFQLMKIYFNLVDFKQ